MRKRKLFVVTRWLDVGGCERHLFQVLPRLASEFDISVFVIHPGGKMEQAFIEAGVPVLTPGAFLGGAPGRLWGIARLVYELLANRDAIVHFFLPEAYLIGGICAALIGHPRMVMSRRSLNLYQMNHPLPACIERKLHGRMRVIVGNSAAVIRDLREEGVDESKLRLIYNGVEACAFRQGEGRASFRKRLGIPDEEMVMMVVANLIPYKGHEDLIRALGAVADHLPAPWRLVLVGRDDGIGASLQRLAVSLGLEERVLFVGQVKEVEGIWSIADIAVLPSHQEGFSNSVLEAMASGLPMVVTDVGGNPEAVLHEVTGLVVPAGSPVELGEALLDLATDERKRRDYGAAAALRAREVFSVDACVKAYKELYASLS